MSVDEESNYVHNSATGIVEATKLLENTPVDNDGGSFHRIKKQSDMSYIRLMRNNRPFRLCLCSYLISHAGEWFTYVASIELLERILGAESSSSRVYIAIITICKQLPNFLLIPFSGVLADAKDKRQSMMFLDLCGAIPPILFLLASYNESISTIYLATLIQACIAALYEPCRASMVPLMVQGGDEMKIAITLMGITWSACLAIGAALGGYMVSKIGINGCFVVDSITFLFSWYLLQLIGGEWNSDASSKNNRSLSFWAQIKDMTVTGFRYIKSTTFWPLILIKPTTAIYQGGVYVLNVSFSEEDPSLSKEDISQRLGIIFLMVGIGCIVGPFITGYFNTTSNPRSILATCLLGYVIGGIGCLGLGYFEKSFAGVAFFSIIRAIGSCATWVDYQVLIQMLAKPEMLGRVIAIDTGLGYLADSCSAIIVGMLQDDLGMSAGEACKVLGFMALFFFVTLSTYGYFASDKLFGPRIAHRKKNDDIDFSLFEDTDSVTTSSDSDMGSITDGSSITV